MKREGTTWRNEFRSKSRWKAAPLPWMRLPAHIEPETALTGDVAEALVTIICNRFCKSDNRVNYVTTYNTVSILNNFPQRIDTRRCSRNVGKQLMCLANNR